MSVVERLHVEDDSVIALPGAVRVTSLLSLATRVHPCLYGHSRRVASLAIEVGGFFGLPRPNLNELGVLGALHDVGKMGVDPAVLGKLGPLTATELRQVRQHPTFGADLIARIPALARLSGPVRHHHEQFDGLGYPDGLSGDELDLRTYILGACDAYDAMISWRPYRPAMASEQALTEVLARAGTQFHPDVVAALVSVLRIEHRLVA